MSIFSRKDLKHRIAIIILSLLCIFLLFWAWLCDFSSSVFCLSADDGYTLFSFANMLIENSDPSVNFLPLVLAIFFFVATFFSFVLFIITIITAILSRSLRRISTISATLAFLIAVIFYILLFCLYLNPDFIYIDFSYKATACPLFLIIFSICIERISLMTSVFPSTPNKSGFCTNCGARVQSSSRFCPHCGRLVPKGIPLTSAQMKKKKINDANTLNAGGWQCSACGRTNPIYTTTCACGKDKRETQF